MRRQPKGIKIQLFAQELEKKALGEVKGGGGGESAEERGSAEKKMEGECRYGDGEEVEEVEKEGGLGDEG